MDESNGSPPVLVTIKEIALIYRTSVRTIYRYISLGYLPPPEKDFGSRLWNREKVIEAMRTRKKSSPASSPR